ncbi:MAG: hypothetical protein ACTSPB_04555 [Candidatus Thorarchaeota archaeon]
MSPGPIDIGNVSVGSTARVGFPIQNRGKQAVMVSPTIDGEIGEIASVTDKVLLRPGESINIQIHINMPENAPIGKVYKGRVYIRTEPANIPGLKTTGAIIKEALLKDISVVAAPSPFVTARAVQFPIAETVIVLILAIVAIVVVVKKPVKEKVRKTKRKRR